MAIEIEVYVQERKLTEVIDYVQGTNALDILFHFRDWQIPSGSTAKIYAHKPSSKAVYNTAVISGNDVSVNVTDQMFSEIGTTKLQIQIVKGEDTLVTFEQPVKVQKNYTTSGEESKNESDFLDNYIDKMTQATGKANTAANNANSAAGRAENAMDAIEGAVKGTLINDDMPSTETVYSSSKVEHLANLFDVDALTLHTTTNATVSTDGNKITVTSKGDINASGQVAQAEIALNKNTWYTVAWKSTRTGKYGGGITLKGFKGSANTDIDSSKISKLNGHISFCTNDYDKIGFVLYSGIKTSSTVGDSATFEIFLVEGIYDFSEEQPVLNNVQDLTQLLLDERTNGANLHNWNGVVFNRCTGTVDGNVLKITSTAVDVSQNAFLSYDFEPGEWYTISWRSTRTGTSGGGINIVFKDGETHVTAVEKPDELNGTATFRVPDKYDIGRAYFFCERGGISNGNVVGKSAMFWDVMLVKGTQYTPPGVLNQKDIVRLSALVNNRTAINLFDYKGIAGAIFVRSTGKIEENKITVTANDLSNYQYVSFRFKNFKPYTNYTISAKSTRTGVVGGGIRVFLAKGDVYTDIGSAKNKLNPVLTFNTGDLDNADFIMVAFQAGDIESIGGKIGDTSTFTDVMIVEGDFTHGKYVPDIGYDTFSGAIKDIRGHVSVDAETGDLTLLGNDVKVRSEKYKKEYVPYYKPGDMLSFSPYDLNTAGFITSSGQKVYFVIPLAKPLLGISSVSCASIDGIMVRQEGKYLYGGNATTSVKPSSYTCYIEEDNHVLIQCNMGNATNVLNNAPCGIAFSATLTFN